MKTQCSSNHGHEKLELTALGKRRVEADFSAGQVSSDGGGLLVREVDSRLQLTERMARCFDDHRDPDMVEHTVGQLLRQLVYGLVLGYEDLSDHEALSVDPLFATMVGKADPSGGDRRSNKDRGQALASPSTLGRLERTKADADASSRYEKIVCNVSALGELFLEVFIESFEHPPARLIIDLDPSDIELHGQQEQRFYHGYYRHHCYLPMYLFCGQHPLFVKLRPSDIDGADGSVEMLAPIVDRIRQAFPSVHLIIRGDSGFCREPLMAWCEGEGVDFVFGIARNKRLEKAIRRQMEQARREHLQTGRAARRFRDFTYRTLKTWSRKRRVIGKAEYLGKGRNPRFVVTTLSPREFQRRYVYEELYCARGEMENRIKEQQLDLFGDRASGHAFQTNSLRIWLSMAAHVLVVATRRLALHGTELAQAQASTLRTKLFKIGALVTVSVRRVYIRFSSAFPHKEVLVSAIDRIRAPPITA
ncbi:MAG: IS1380 family transposase [bacterium]|nr:IS1380 family transposase [bacterium]